MILGSLRDLFLPKGKENFNILKKIFFLSLFFTVLTLNVYSQTVRYDLIKTDSLNSGHYIYNDKFIFNFFVMDTSDSEIIIYLFDSLKNEGTLIDKFIFKNLETGNYQFSFSFYKNQSIFKKGNYIYEFISNGMRIKIGKFIIENLNYLE